MCKRFELLPPPEEREERVAVVTGGNRGIGLEVCRLLAHRGWRVVLGARDAGLGAAAAAEIRARHPDAAVAPCLIDVEDERSIDALQAMVRADFGRCDAVINNAGVCLDGTDADTLRRSFEVNTFGPARVVERLLALRGDAPCAVVNVSSGDGELLWFESGVQERLAAVAAAEASSWDGVRAAALEPLRAWMEEMAADSPRWADGAHGETPAYKLSKAALNAWTRVLAMALRAGAGAGGRGPHSIVVNAVCPGDVRTRMGPPHADVEPEEAAAGVVWAALLAGRGPSGGFYRDGEPIDW
eukprot:tig00020943_g16252.t1